MKNIYPLAAFIVLSLTTTTPADASNLPARKVVVNYRIQKISYDRTKADEETGYAQKVEDICSGQSKMEFVTAETYRSSVRYKHKDELPAGLAANVDCAAELNGNQIRFNFYAIGHIAPWSKDKDVYVLRSQLWAPGEAPELSVLRRDDFSADGHMFSYLSPKVVGTCTQEELEKTKSWDLGGTVCLGVDHFRVLFEVVPASNRQE